MRIRNLEKLVALLCALPVIGCAVHREFLTGVYSNGQSEFSASSIFLSREGYGLFTGGVGGALGSWEIVTQEGCDFVHMRLADTFRQSEVREYSALLQVNDKDRSLRLVTITNTLASAFSYYSDHRTGKGWNRDGHYHFKTNTVPSEIETMLAKFPNDLERAKKSAEAFRRAREAEKARLAAEKPRYEAFRAKIVEDPSVVGSVELEFVKEGEGPGFLVGKARQTPECRALIDALKDRAIVFPEDALMTLVEKYPWDGDFFIVGHVFSRDELSAAARRKLHPRMRDFANRLNSDFGGAFYEHPNTPIDLVKEALSWEHNGIGFINHLEARLKREGVSVPKRER